MPTKYILVKIDEGTQCVELETKTLAARLFSEWVASGVQPEKIIFAKKLSTFGLGFSAQNDVND